MSAHFDPAVHLKHRPGGEFNQISTIVQRLHQKMQRDQLVQTTTAELRDSLQVDRVVLYHFHPIADGGSQWEGQVTFESLRDGAMGILGSTGPAQCFTDEYAALYLAGRVRAIADIELEPIQACHRDFLRDLQVRANLVVPILTARGLWGLLVAHHCQSARSWSLPEIDRMQLAALALATAPSIQDN